MLLPIAIDANANCHCCLSPLLLMPLPITVGAVAFVVDAIAIAIDVIAVIIA